MQYCPQKKKEKKKKERDANLVTSFELLKFYQHSITIRFKSNAKRTAKKLVILTSQRKIVNYPLTGPNIEAIAGRAHRRDKKV